MGYIFLEIIHSMKCFVCRYFKTMLLLSSGEWFVTNDVRIVFFTTLVHINLGSLRPSKLSTSRDLLKYTLLRDRDRERKRREKNQYPAGFEHTTS